jgi:hypothetical protein
VGGEAGDWMVLPLVGLFAETVQQHV